MILQFEVVCVVVQRTGLFTPDMAFEAIVKKQIERLKSPAVQCVEMVVEELIRVVHACSERVCIICLSRGCLEILCVDTDVGS